MVAILENLVTHVRHVQKAEEIHEGMWYRYYSDIDYTAGISWKQWVKAGVSGTAYDLLDYDAITPLTETSLRAETDWRGQSYFIPASFEKAERLEKQLERERREEALWTGTPRITLRLSED